MGIFQIERIVNLIAYSPIMILARTLRKLSVVKLVGHNIVVCICSLGKLLVCPRRIRTRINLCCSGIVRHSLAEYRLNRQSWNNLVTSVERKFHVRTVRCLSCIAHLAQDIKLLVHVSRCTFVGVIVAQIAQVGCIRPVIIVWSLIWIGEHCVCEGVDCRSVIAVLARVCRKIDGYNKSLDGAIVKLHEQSGILILIRHENTVLVLEAK